MARPKKQERQAQRASERAEALLARGRFAEVMDLLPAVSGPVRDAALKAIAAAMASDIARAHTQGAQATLVEWIHRIEREPRLLELLGAGALATRYALLVAALRGGMWPRAEALWSAIRAPFATHPLYEALEAVVSSRGAAEDVLARFEEEAQRLGYDAPARPATYPTPRELGEIEDCCLRCFGSEPWWRFRDVTLDWLRHMPAEHAQRLRVLAAELSEAELLTRAGAENANVAEVVKYIATLARDAGAPETLESSVALCLRVLFRTLLQAAAPDSTFDALAVLAPVAYRYESLHDALLTVIFGIPLARISPAKQNELLRVAIAADPSPSRLLAVARVLRGPDDQGDVPPAAPAWFVDAFETALREPRALADAMRAQLTAADPADARQESNGTPGALCEPLLDLLPVPLAVAAVESVWAYADEPLRRELSLASDVLLARMEEEPDLNAAYDALFEHLPDLAMLSKHELQRFIDSEDVARYVEGTIERPGIDPEFVFLARKLTHRIAPYNVRALDVALELTPDKRQRVRLTDAFLARLPTLCQRVKAMFSAVSEELGAALPLLEKRCFEGLVATPLDAAIALIMLEKTDAPRRIRVSASRALLAAVEREPDAMAHADVASAVNLAKRWVRPRKASVKRKPKTAKRKTVRVVVNREFDWATIEAEGSHARR